MTTYNVPIEDTIEALDLFKQFLLTNMDRIGAVKFDVGFSVINATPDELRALASCKGGWQKDATDSLYVMSHMFGAVEFEAYNAREEVCEATPTGRKVTVHKVVTPAVYGDVEEDEIEWSCFPVLAERSGA